MKNKPADETRQPQPKAILRAQLMCPLCRRQFEYHAVAPKKPGDVVTDAIVHPANQACRLSGNRYEAPLVELTEMASL